MSEGHNPLNDQTAWYPDLSVSHREISQIAYLESVWYSIYTAGDPNISNYLLVLVSSAYPVIAALFMVVSIYLLVSVATRREFGLFAAGAASFLPVVVLKLSSGEIESQPYAFFGIAFTLAMLAFAIREKKIKFAVLAGLGIVATFLGSSVGSLLVTMIGLALLIYPIAIFVSREEDQELIFLSKTSAIMFICAFVANFIRGYLQTNTIEIGLGTQLLLVGAAIVNYAAAHAQKMKIEISQKRLMIAIVIVFAFAVFMILPYNFPLKEIGRSQFQIASFNVPLDRTIAEQRLAGDSFGESLGFFAEKYDRMAATILLPIKMIIPQSTQFMDQSAVVLGKIFEIIFALFSIVSNLVLKITIGTIDLMLGTKVNFQDKANSLILFWIFVVLLAMIYSAYEFLVNKKDNLFIVFASALAFPLLVGMVKDKYAIYAGVMLAISVGFALGTIYQAIEERLKEEKLKNKLKKTIIYAAMAIVFLQFIYNGFSIGLLIGSVSPLYQNDPVALTAKFSSMCQETGGNDPQVCAAARDPLGYANQGLEFQYNQKLCMLSSFSSYSNAVNQDSAPFWERISASYRCQRLATYWVSSMEWIKQNTPEDARIISWWDYGHWTNYFGQRNSVLRNDHKSNRMIGEVADVYLDKGPQELAAYMRSKGSEYALFDMELVSSGQILGGKYGALNYLSCAHNNETNVSASPGESKCEEEHVWENVIITQNRCTISKTANQSGLSAYKLEVLRNAQGETVTIPDYPDYCNDVKDTGVGNYCSQIIKPKAVYCIGDAILANGQKTTAPYDLNKKDENGDLKWVKAQFGFAIDIPRSYHFGAAKQATLFYTNEPIWFENGSVVSGMGDAKSKFYKSNLYRALFLNDLPGFTQVYSSANGEVKIYKLNN